MSITHFKLITARNEFVRTFLTNGAKYIGRVDVNDIPEAVPNHALAYGCRDLLERTPNFRPIFDALVLDEGQDLMTEDDK